MQNSIKRLLKWNLPWKLLMTTKRTKHHLPVHPTCIFDRHPLRTRILHRVANPFSVKFYPVMILNYWHHDRAWSDTQHRGKMDHHFGRRSNDALSNMINFDNGYSHHSYRFAILIAPNRVLVMNSHSCYRDLACAYRADSHQMDDQNHL